MPSHASGPPTTSLDTYSRLLAHREFAGLYASFTLTTAASALSGLALGTLVHRQTGSALLTAIAMYGATLATVVGALTLMSLADARRPRRTLLVLQLVSLAGVAGQAVPGIPLATRFLLLVVLGFLQSLGTGTRMGLLSEVVPSSSYALARSLMNITAGGMSILALAVGALLLATLSPQGLFLVATAPGGLAVVVVAGTIRERSIRLSTRPGLRQTWVTNRALFARPGRRALLVNLWVPNGLVVGCEALFISWDPAHAGVVLAAGSAGMLLGDLAVGRLMSASARQRSAFALRLLLAAPFLVFAASPGLVLAAVAVFVASAGFAATLPLQEKLMDLTAPAVRGQVQGVESAGRMTWQGLGAAIAGAVAQVVHPGTAMAVMALASLAVTIGTKPWVDRAGRRARAIEWA